MLVKCSRRQLRLWVYMQVTGFFHSTSTAYCRCQWEVILAIQDIRVQQGNGSLKKMKKKAIFSLLSCICISEMSGWFEKIKQHTSGIEGVLCAVFFFSYFSHILSFMRCSNNSTFMATMAVCTTQFPGLWISGARLSYCWPRGEVGSS